MTSPATSIELDTKKALFSQLDALDYASDDDIDEKVWEQERKRKERCRLFTTRVDTKTTPAGLIPVTAAPATSVPAPVPAPGVTSIPIPIPIPIPGPAHPSTTAQVIDLTSNEVEPVVIPQTVTPKLRRNQSAPGIVKNTPVNRRINRGPDLLRTASERAATASITVIEDTPIPDSTKLVRQTSALLGFDSPSAIAANMSKKRKRGELRLVPEPDRIFKDLNFFYIPNNDIHPARKIRITKAREYGANWVRKIEDATHVIVDKDLQYKDISGMLAQAGNYVVVIEDYPVDCVRYKTILNTCQKLYEVKGYPLPQQATEQVTEEAGASRATPLLKPPPNNNNNNNNKQSHKRDRSVQATAPHPMGALSELVPQKLAPAVPSLQRHATVPARPGTLPTGTGERTMSSPVQPPSQCRTPSPPKSSQQTIHKDELSKYIDMMQQYKDLPLDKDSDDEDAKCHVQDTDSDDSISEGERDYKRQKATKAKKALAKDGNKMKKEISFKDRFACHRGGTKESKAEAANNPNKRTIEVLQSLLDYYDRTDDTWRIFAYRKAIGTLRRQKTQIRTAEEAYLLPNIGSRLADKIEEIATTDRLRRLENVQQEPQDKSLQLFLGVYGAGTSVAQRWVAQGFSTLEDLLKGRGKEDGNLAKRRRATGTTVGAGLTPNQRMGVERHSDLNSRIPRHEARAMAEHLRSVGEAVDAQVEMIVSGSYRRGAESSGDVDMLVTRKGTTTCAELVPFLEKVLAKLEETGVAVYTVASLKRGGTDDSKGSKWHGCCVLPENVARKLSPRPEQSKVSLPFPSSSSSGYNPIWRRVDLLLVPDSELGAALLYFTGNDIFNRSMRLLASRKGMRLNQRGLYKEVLRGPGRVKVTDGQLVEGRDERKIFEILGVTWREPWERWC